VLDPSDTIVAISGHPGPAARGLVRLSGPAALAVALEGFAADDGPCPIPTRPVSLAGEYSIGARLPATLVLWPGPRSYTGGPVAEIHTVGSPPILDHLVGLCLARGARLAEPGEFTLRAFLSGRIDLSQSEAVLGVIEARTPAQLDAALRQLAGGLASPVRDLRDRLLDRLVGLEADLDFVDESDVAPVVRADLVSEIVAAIDGLGTLIARHGGRDRPEARPRVVLAGRPNAGKSRLFNALIGDDRAIVSPSAGTTRDDLSALVACDGLPIELIDTAGDEAAVTEVDAASQSRRASQVERADLILQCVPADEAKTTMDPLVDPRTIRVVTKSDLGPRDHPGLALMTSARTGAGLDRLRTAIADRLRSSPSGSGSLQGYGSHCRDGLVRAVDSLRNALGVATCGGGEELIAAELRQAIDELGRLVGAVVTEDILDGIFRRFCIGK